MNGWRTSCPGAERGDQAGVDRDVVNPWSPGRAEKPWNPALIV